MRVSPSASRPSFIVPLVEIFDCPARSVRGERTPRFLSKDDSCCRLMLPSNFRSAALGTETAAGSIFWAVIVPDITEDSIFNFGSSRLLSAAVSAILTSAAKSALTVCRSRIGRRLRLSTKLSMFSFNAALFRFSVFSLRLRLSFSLPLPSHCLISINFLISSRADLRSADRSTCIFRISPRPSAFKKEERNARVSNSNPAWFIFPRALTFTGFVQDIFLPALVPCKRSMRASPSKAVADPAVSTPAASTIWPLVILVPFRNLRVAGNWVDNSARSTLALPESRFWLSEPMTPPAEPCASEERKVSLSIESAVSVLVPSRSISMSLIVGVSEPSGPPCSLRVLMFIFPSIFKRSALLPVNDMPAFRRPLACGTAARAAMMANTSASSQFFMRILESDWIFLTFRGSSAARTREPSPEAWPSLSPDSAEKR